MPPKTPPTHFLCIPLVTSFSRPQLSTSLSAFKSDITSPDSFAVPEQAVRPVGTLHLTLGVMSFPKDEGLEAAIDLLKSLVPKQILTDIQSDGGGGSSRTQQSSPLTVTLRGLQSMQAASKVSVLYAPPSDDEGTLSKFCNKLKSAFLEAGLMTPDNRPLLLHTTVVNTIYVKGRKHKGRQERLTIDARGILDRYDDFTWMQDVPVESIAICRMGAKKQENGDEAYEVEAEIGMAS